MGCHLTDKRYSTAQFYVTGVFMVGTVAALFLCPLFLLGWFSFRYLGLSSLSFIPPNCFFIFMAFWSYLKTMFCDVGFTREWILDKFKAAANIDDAELPEEQIKAICSEIGWRYCKKCSLPKPPRSHHCSDCKQCILQMDHHCPWMNNCVGHANHKYFLLFLFWTDVTICFNFVVSCFVRLFAFSSKMNNFVLVGCIIYSGSFAILLVAFACSHITFVLNNEGTLDPDRSDHKRENPYYINHRENWIQVFGENPILWLFPVPTTKGDGVSFKRNPNYVPDLEAGEEPAADANAK